MVNKNGHINFLLICARLRRNKDFAKELGENGRRYVENNVSIKR